MTNNLRGEGEDYGVGAHRTTKGHCFLQGKEPTQDYTAKKSGMMLPGQPRDLQDGTAWTPQTFCPFESKHQVGPFFPSKGARPATLAQDLIIVSDALGPGASTYFCCLVSIAQRPAGKALGKCGMKWVARRINSLIGRERWLANSTAKQRTNKRAEHVSKKSPPSLLLF